MEKVEKFLVGNPSEVEKHVTLGLFRFLGELYVKKAYKFAKMEHIINQVMSNTDEVWIESTLVLLTTIRKVCMNFGGKREFEFHFYFPEIR